MFYEGNKVDEYMNLEILEKLSFYLCFYNLTCIRSVAIPGLLQFAIRAMDFFSTHLNYKLKLTEEMFVHPILFR